MFTICLELLMVIELELLALQPKIVKLYEIMKKVSYQV